jgi:hypothetical protein
VRCHDEANKILDMTDRAEQVRHYKALSPELKKTVGELVKIANSAERFYRFPAWRVTHKNQTAWSLHQSTKANRAD